MESFEVYLVIDADGNYEVGTDLDCAKAAYAENVGGLDECEGWRAVCVKVKAALPKVVELDATGEAAELPTEA